MLLHETKDNKNRTQKVVATDNANSNSIYMQR